ncbi:hypothetical protein ACLRGF_14015 [Mycetocola zhadangensis]|uniref:hypothetical protein n=1 Tax=Mycetocola zhadangensis TaxID=1164595 RepID=UPI003A4D2376
MRESADLAPGGLGHVTGRRGIAGWLDPRRAFWLGVVLIVSGAYGPILLTLATTALGGQDLVTSWPIWSLTYLLVVAQYLGAGFLVAAMVARALERRLPVAALPAAEPEDARVPPRVSPRLATLVGVGLILISLVDQNLHFAQPVPANPGVQRDLSVALVPLLSALAPLGSALVPGGWLLARIELTPVAAKASVEQHE